MKTDKKVFTSFTVVGIIILTLCLSSCGNSKSNTAEKSLYTQGMELVQLMSEAAQSEEYIEIYTGNSEIKSILQNIGAGDHSAPKAVYAISISDENLTNMAELSNLDNPSEALRAFLTQRTFSAVMTQINALSGTESLAAASICTLGKTFVNENANENIIYLYTYDHAVPAAITFIAGENHAVSASGVFVVYDGFTCDSADDIKSFFSDIIVDVTEVRPE